MSSFSSPTSDLPCHRRDGEVAEAGTGRGRRGKRADASGAVEDADARRRRGARGARGSATRDADAAGRGAREGDAQAPRGGPPRGSRSRRRGTPRDTGRPQSRDATCSARARHCAGGARGDQLRRGEASSTLYFTRRYFRARRLGARAAEGLSDESEANAVLPSALPMARAVRMMPSRASASVRVRVDLSLEFAPSRVPIPRPCATTPTGIIVGSRAC